LKLIAEDGKKVRQFRADIEGLFRIIQSIPSLEFKPFKGWLAKVGYERAQKTEDSGLAPASVGVSPKAGPYS